MSLLGNRIPRQFFVTQGSGESDLTEHAGSFHLALRKAGIETQNIMTYSSVLPARATRIDKPPELVFGSVMDTIMSVVHGGKGSTLLAGVGYSRLLDRETRVRAGGFVCEHSMCREGLEKESIGHLVKQLREGIVASLDEVYRNGYYDEYTLAEPIVMVEAFTPKKIYGTALVALCFVNHEQGLP